MPALIEANRPCASETPREPEDVRRISAGMGRDAPRVKKFPAPPGGGRQKKPGRSAPEQQRQEENGDAAALASHVPNIQTSELPASSKNFFGTFTAGF
ncbi:hypothetical protein C0Z18_29850 [Trinickia dabaoshanensis]|uniref:Uncharacterized protein n=2 Tax=Trinickia dabaoshanensis TaxID=564714 RepID=A0A2N7VCF7_9BURK|nr:hypothetical protein C0Z18_29850 [Trinickia dabaoshanensis]